VSVRSVEARVRDNGCFLESKVYNFDFAGDSAAIHISGVSEIGRCPQGQKWLYPYIPITTPFNNNTALIRNIWSLELTIVRVWRGYNPIYHRVITLVSRYRTCRSRVITFCVITICVRKTITFCVEKLIHFALTFLLHFALVLHFAAIFITFCVNITFCGDYYVLRRNNVYWQKWCTQWAP